MILHISAIILHRQFVSIVATVAVRHTIKTRESVKILNLPNLVWPNALVRKRQFYNMKRKRPLLFTIDPCHRVRRHDQTKAQVIDARSPEARDSTVSVTATPCPTYSASVRHAQSSARGRKGRASSNGGHARPPSARLSQPRRLCIANGHMPGGRNHPPLSGFRIALRRPSTARNTERVRRDLVPRASAPAHRWRHRTKKRVGQERG